MVAGWQHGVMTVIKINAITVPRESGDELAQRFAARAGAVDDADGFEGFELLKPTDDREQWLVITRWRDEESFQAWLGSECSPTAIAPPPSGRTAPPHNRSRGTARCGPTSWPAVPIPVELRGSLPAGPGGSRGPLRHGCYRIADVLRVRHARLEAGSTPVPVASSPTDRKVARFIEAVVSVDGHDRVPPTHGPVQKGDAMADDSTTIKRLPPSSRWPRGVRTRRPRLWSGSAPHAIRRGSWRCAASEPSTPAADPAARLDDPHLRIKRRVPEPAALKLREGNERLARTFGRRSSVCTVTCFDEATQFALRRTARPLRPHSCARSRS